MNSLSWLLYVAEVIPSLGSFLTIAGVLVIAGTTGALVYDAMERDFAYNDAPGYGAEGREQARETPRWQSAVSIQKTALKVLPFCLVFFLLSAAIPSKQTILMIAASEMGEAVVKTPEAQEIFGDLKAILKKQLEEMKK